MACPTRSASISSGSAAPGKFLTVIVPWKRGQKPAKLQVTHEGDITVVTPPQGCDPLQTGRDMVRGTVGEMLKNSEKKGSPLF